MVWWSHSGTSSDIRVGPFLKLNMKSSRFTTMSPAELKAKSGKYFGVHGRFCSSHPWEVIVTTVTLTVCVLSMSILSGGKLGVVCGINKPCQKKSPEEEKADSFLMIIVNSLAVLYLYNQFSNLRKVGSKYLLGIAAIFTIFASFVFGSGIVYFVDSSAAGLSEALPFFLLLIDLSKATALAEFASVSSNRDEVRSNIANGMAVLGPSFSLDTLVEVLIISIGTISGVRQLETVCYFGCMSLIANYLVFMTFFPAALALILEVCPHNPANKTWHIDKLARAMQEGENRKKPNPVVQRVKIIMALGLVVVHIHSRFLSQVTGMSFYLSTAPALVESEGSYQETERVPLHDYLWWKAFHLSADQLVTVGLGVVLLLKYTFYDKTNTVSSSQFCSKQMTSSTVGIPSVDGDITTAYFRKRSITINSHSGMRKDSGIEECADKEIGSCSVSSTVSVAVQTEEHHNNFFICNSPGPEDSNDAEISSQSNIPVHDTPRSVAECLEIFKSKGGPSQLTDDEVMSLVVSKHIPAYKLEAVMGDMERSVLIRRKLVSSCLPDKESLESLPYTGYDYKHVVGACCENVIGYLPMPVGVAGPLLLDNKEYYVPMSTTEGCLIASTNRGCRALMMGSGVHSNVLDGGMTRAPVVRMPTASRAIALKHWLDTSDKFQDLCSVFNMTSRYAKLQSVHTAVAGRLVYIRFRATTGDAMGMNMLSKGVEKALEYLHDQFSDMDVLSLSGNYCTDKKPSAVNWIEGRGKSVVCDATIPADVVEKVLKTSVDSLIDLNVSKNLVGSAMAGSIGGFNAHAANIVSAVFIATGQDVAQVVGSSNCITLIEKTGPSNSDLYISCTMPSLEVGTVGGGTFLPPQSSCLKMLGLNGSSVVGKPGDNSSLLARVVCGTVLAGELSLISALAAGHLVRSHLTMNRSKLNLLPQDNQRN